MNEQIVLLASHLSSHKDKYVVIGGQACRVLHEDSGSDFGRVTKDVDIVLIVEKFNEYFYNDFTAFLQLGNYTCWKSSSDKNSYYRFMTKNEQFPSIIELFARAPVSFDLLDGVHLTPVLGGDGASLSAILLDDTYYNFVVTHKQDVAGLMVATIESLILLKIKAFLDMKQREDSATPAHSNDIKKHPRDIAGLISLLPMNPFSEPLPHEMLKDIQEFCGNVRAKRGEMTDALQGYFGITRHEI